MSRILFLVCFLFSSNAVADETFIQNDSIPTRHVRLFEHMQATHTDFSINIPSENINIPVSYFHQVGIEGSTWTKAVVQQAAEIFVLWANERGHELSSNGRRNIDLYVYDVHIELLNNPNIMYYINTITEQRPGENGVTGLYDAHSISGTNVIFIAANKERSAYGRSGTVAHELAHFLCDYFRIYDNYYETSRGEYNVEGPAYDFERYFSRRTRY
jgi:hypothetical protein